MTARMALPCVLAGLAMLGLLAAWISARAAARRDRERYSRQFIYAEWARRQALAARVAEKRRNDRIEDKLKENHNG